MTSKYETGSEQADVQSPPGSSRRAALKKMLVGTGAVAGAVALPGKWTQPLVDKVLVPAHAQTSPTTTQPPATTTTTTTTLEPCEIAGTYCWGYDPEEFYMTITVGADGSVQIDAPGWSLGIDNVPIRGGDFSITMINPERDVTVTGSVVCNSDSISGTVEFIFKQVTVPYTATATLCGDLPS